MTQVSKYPVRKDVYEEIFNVLLETVAGLVTKDQVASFFEEFFTPTERIMFAKRLAVGIFIAKGYDYHEIVDLIKVSSSTVAGCSTLYKYGENYRKVVDEILRNKKLEKFLLELAEIIASAGTVGRKGTGSWIYLRNQLKKKRLNKVI